MCKQRNTLRWKNRCNNCKGKGWVKCYRHGEDDCYRRTCPVCKGTGKSTLDK